MKKDTAFEDKRLLEAINHIDSRYISEAMEYYGDLPPVGGLPERDKRVTRKSIRYALAIAACFLLIGAVIPVVTNIIQKFSGSAGGNPEETILSLEDFVYDTEIDTDHVITEAELGAINKLWLYEFGKKFAETPEEAMRRETKGDFYFGRYGRTFVFYIKQFNMDMEFRWGKHNFVMPWGLFFFINGDKVYTRQEFMVTDLFTQEHIDTLYDSCMNFYPSYVPVITLPEGDHVLSSEELAAMQEAFDGSVTYSIFASLESTMRRKQNSSYYFGKFGDTVIVWVNEADELRHGFEWSGYNFDFNFGRLYFYENGKFYDHITAAENNIMTAEEIKAFYDHYSERFVPFNAIPYTCLEFTDGVEKLGEDEMRSIDEAYAAWKYEQEYKYYYETYIEAKYSEQKAHESADRAAYRQLSRDNRHFFKEENYQTFRYYGKKGNKVFLVEKDRYADWNVFDLAGYKFVIDGGAGDILVYSGGEFTDLSEAYEKGMISKEDVKFVYERHLAYTEYFRDGMEEIAPPARLKIGVPYNESPIKLSEELQREIVWEYIADSTRLEEDLMSSYAVRCYGRSGDTYAVMIDGPWLYTQAMRSEIVAGYTFSFSDGQQMYIYKQGEFYSLRKAYELGIVNEEDIVAIKWAKTAPYTYETATAPIKIDEKEVALYISTYALSKGGHKKGAVYSMRCYGKAERGYAVFIDCTDKVYAETRTVETVCGYEFIYPTEQTMLFCYNWSDTSSLAEALENDWLEESELKEIYETYRAEHPELYK